MSGKEHLKGHWFASFFPIKGETRMCFVISQFSCCLIYHHMYVDTDCTQCTFVIYCINQAHGFALLLPGG